MRTQTKFIYVSLLATVVLYPFTGCRSVQQHRREADEAAYNIIKQKQQQILGQEEPFTIEKPADTLRRRLMLDQNLPFAGGAGLSTRDIKPIKQWPDHDYLDPTKGPPATMPSSQGGPLRLSLIDALQVAAYNSREYQARKETVFTDALALELQRDRFRTSFAAAMSNRTSWDLGADDPIVGNVTSGDIGITQRFANGAVASVRLALDLAKLLTQSHNASLGMAVDGSITMPLLAGSGSFIVMEPLTQAERNVAYDLLEFEQYKRQFAVSIASSYYTVLQQFDRLKNQEDNYKRVVRTTRISRSMANEDRQAEIQFDEAFQQELGARDSWISSMQNARRQLDSFKVLLGLPPDAQIDLEPTELQQLRTTMMRMLKITPPAAIDDNATTQPNARIEGVGATTQPAETRPPTTRPPTTQPADTDIILVPPSGEGAGPYELAEELAVRLAFENRPDLRITLGEVIDAQRKVVVAADALGMGLDLAANGSFGSLRGSPGSAVLDDARLRPTKGNYSVGVATDLPLERTAEQNTYRSSLIAVERSVRAVQQLEDDIKLSLRNDLRTLLQARESLGTQTLAVAVAQRRVQSTQMSFELGRVGTLMKDVLNAQADLVNAENNLTSAIVNYRLAELQLQRDLGLLQCNNEGLWQEYSPKGEAK
ncbi:MAG: TolC family protein [Planctomycetota bacterium]|nr:TolC family protein [Planctomycetota bacterium]